MNLFPSSTKSNGIGLLSGALIISSLAPAANAVVYSASSGGLSASADFSIVSGNLQIILTNTSLNDTVNSAGLLTGVYFTLPDGSTNSLSRVGGSVVLAPGSSVIGGGTDPGGVVGGEFAFVSNISLAPFIGYYGVSSSGLGIFGGGDRFPGTDLDSPASPNGSNYGIASAGDDVTTGNTGLLGEPFIKNSVLITLTAANGFNLNTLDLNAIGNVTFQYGTDLSEPRLTSIPETTSSFALGGVLVAGAFMRVRRKGRRSS